MSRLILVIDRDKLKESGRRTINKSGNGKQGTLRLEDAI